MRVRAYGQRVAYGGTVVRMTGWTVVLPVKDLEQAKRRLAHDVGRWRPALAEAFAADVLDAALAVAEIARVLVVGGAGISPSELARPRVFQLPDAGGLDAAVTSGLTRARADSPGCRVLVLQADLPCLRPTDLECLLSIAPTSRPGVLADADGLGTVALTLPGRTTLTTAFGAGSLDRHLRAGAERIDLSAPRLRRDVDTLAHLQDAIRLGVGNRTRQVLERMQFPDVRDRTA